MLSLDVRVDGYSGGGACLHGLCRGRYGLRQIVSRGRGIEGVGRGGRCPNSQTV